MLKNYINVINDGAKNTENNFSNKWSGLNPSVAKRNIENFYNKSCESIQLFVNCINELFSNLENIWVSPNAVRFGLKYENVINDLISKFLNEVFLIVKNACKAYNLVASSQGSPRLRNFDKYDIKKVIFNLKDSKDGIIGMNINLVENDVIPEFERKMNSIISYINDIPRNIALYDDINGQSHFFSSNVGLFKRKIEDTVDSIKISIKIYANNEIDNIRLAKQNAINELNNY